MQCIGEVRKVPRKRDARGWNKLKEELDAQNRVRDHYLKGAE